ncbi:hypothetical protein QTP88_024169 [Uroleucon formosanum]
MPLDGSGTIPVDESGRAPRRSDSVITIIEPLVELIRKDNSWKWENKHSTAFEESKTAFLKKIITTFPDFTFPFYINADASTSAIGGELFQVINNERLTIGFASRTLQPAETRYTTTELEALAILYYCTKFRPYLIGNKTIIQTNHHALTFIKQSKLTSGKDNIVADTLLKYPRTGEERPEEKIKLNKIAPLTINKQVIEKIKNIAQEQTKDKHAQNKRQVESSYSKPPSKRPNNRNTNKHGSPWTIQDIPRTKRHLHFPKYAEVNITSNKKLRHLPKNKPINYNASGKSSSEKPTKPLERVSIDMMGPLPTGKGGTHYILAILDVFSKYIKLYAIKRATKKSIVNKLINDYISTTGKPESIISDNGTQFTSKSWYNTLKERYIKCIFTTKYHPQSNPVERYNKER